MKTILTAAALVLLLTWVGPSLMDAPSEHEAAEDMADEVMSTASELDDMAAQIELEAARLCVRISGPGATHSWTADYRLTCINPTTHQQGAL